MQLVEQLTCYVSDALAEVPIYNLQPARRMLTCESASDDQRCFAGVIGQRRAALCLPGKLSQSGTLQVARLTTCGHEAHLH